MEATSASKELRRIYHLAYIHANCSVGLFRQIFKRLIDCTPRGDKDQKIVAIVMAAIALIGLALDPLVLLRFILTTFLLILFLCFSGVNPDGYLVRVQVLAFVLEYLCLLYKVVLVLLAVLLFLAQLATFGLMFVMLVYGMWFLVIKAKQRFHVWRGDGRRKSHLELTAATLNVTEVNEYIEVKALRGSNNVSSTGKTKRIILLLLLPV